MIRTGGISRRRSYPSVLLCDKIVIGELFIGGVSPKFLADPLVHAFGEGLGQAIRECLKQNGAIVVVISLELGQFFFNTDARCNCKAADIISNTCFLWRDEIGECRIGP